MKPTLTPYAAALALLFPPPTAPAAESWAHWRGPEGNGTAPDAKPPVEWGEDKNVAWKVPVPGKGSASPVVWEDRIFVSTAVPTGTDPDGKPAQDAENQPRVVQQFKLLCYNRADGKVLWERTAAETVPAKGHHPDHGFASASPMTDGERVYAHFGSRGLFAFTIDGEPVWQYTKFEPMETRGGFGEGSSPTLHDGRIIVPWDHQGQSYILAIDAQSGEPVWKTSRDEPSSWGTPLVVTHNQKRQVVATGENFARGYDFDSGEELWRCPGQTTRPVASPVAADGIALVGSGFQGSFFGAFALGASGNLKDTKAVIWTADRDTPDVASPVLSGGRLYYTAGKSAALTCRDAATGKIHFERERVPGIGNIYASPLAANGHLYIWGRNGTTVVLEDATTFTIIATNQLDEGIDATPAAVGNDLVVRTTHHLYRLNAE